MTHSRDDGSAAVEFAVLTPVVLLVGLVVVAAARLVTAHAAVEHAAEAASRAASLARSAAAAQRVATDTGTRTVADQGFACRQTDVALDSRALTAPPGNPGLVAVRMRCTVALADLAVPGLPGAVPITSDFASPVDPFRTRP